MQSTNFYLQHKGLILNLLSVGLFLLFRFILKEQDATSIAESPLIGLLYVLVIVLAFGELLVKELFRELDLSIDQIMENGWIVLFPIILFFLVFYFPVRCIYTIEDFTFARTLRAKSERLAGFLLVFTVLLLA